MGTRRFLFMLLSVALVIGLTSIPALADYAGPDPGSPTLQEYADDGDPIDNIVFTAAQEAVYDLTRIGDVIYAGGDFTEIDTGATNVTQPYLAAFDAATGSLITAFDPNLNGLVRAVAPNADGSVLFVAGQFSSVNGTTREGIAALNPNNGNLIGSFVADIDKNEVFDLEIAGNALYAAGNFSRINGLHTGRVAKIDAATGQADNSWKPKPNRLVESISMTPAQDRLYMAGKFTQIKDQASNAKFAAVDLDTGAEIESFDPNTSTAARSIDSTDSRVVVTHRGSNKVTLWNPSGSKIAEHLNGSGDYQIVEIVGDRALIGSHSEVIGGIESIRLHAISLLTGAVDAGLDTDVITWPGVFAIYGSGNDLWLGGGFTRVGATASKGLAKIPSDPNQTPPSTPGSFTAVAESDAVDLDWSSSSDDTGIRGYRVLRSGYQIAFVTASQYSDDSVEDGATYQYHVEAIDDDFNVSDRSPGRTAGLAGNPPDTQDPVAVIDAPADGSLLPGSNVTFSGTASDNQGLAEVYTVIRDKGTSLYLQSDLSWGTSYTKIPSLLSNPGGTASGWSATFALPDGDYWMKAVPKDLAGNIPGTKPRVDFEVGDAAPPDNQAPIGTISEPDDGDDKNGPSVTFNGTATDNVGVDIAFVAIKDTDRDLYLQDDLSWVSGYNRIGTNLTNEGGTSTNWSITFDLPDGDYFVELVVKDTSGNKNSPVPRNLFTVS